MGFNWAPSGTTVTCDPLHRTSTAPFFSILLGTINGSVCHSQASVYVFPVHVSVRRFPQFTASHSLSSSRAIVWRQWKGGMGGRREWSLSPPQQQQPRSRWQQGHVITKCCNLLLLWTAGTPVSARHCLGMAAKDWQQPLPFLRAGLCIYHNGKMKCNIVNYSKS